MPRINPSATIDWILIDDGNLFFIYLLRFGLNFLYLHLRQVTAFSAIFRGEICWTVLHRLQTNLFLNRRASASGNFAIILIHL